MRKMIVISLIALSLFFVPSRVIAQKGVKKIELKVVPFFIDYAKFDPFKDLNHAGLIIIIRESALLHFSNDDFGTILKSIGPDKIDNNVATDYRVKCTVFFISGKTKTLYMNSLGAFFYKGNNYKDERIKEFIFKHIPESYKTM